MADRAPQGPGALDVTTSIVILGLSRGTFHHGALAIARSAGRLGIPVYRVALERRSPAALSRYSRGWRFIPADATAEQVLQTLGELRREAGRAILIPVDDAGSVFVEEHLGTL